MKAQLNPKILARLSKKTGLKESTIRQQISTLKQQNARCTLNAVAQIYAMKHSATVMQQLTDADKATLPHIEQSKEKIKITSKSNFKNEQDKIKILIEYENDDYFIKGHIKEFNRAYTHKCYTGGYILLRKIIENLIVDILQRKYPPDVSIDNKELYWDIKQKRFKDFSLILKNLYDKRDEFSPSKSKAIEKLYQLSKNFKDEANNKTHSWFHLVLRPKELDDLEPQKMIELIKTIEK